MSFLKMSKNVSNHSEVRAIEMFDIRAQISTI